MCKDQLVTRVTHKQCYTGFRPAIVAVAKIHRELKLAISPPGWFHYWVDNMKLEDPYFLMDNAEVGPGLHEVARIIDANQLLYKVSTLCEPDGPGHFDMNELARQTENLRSVIAGILGRSHEHDWILAHEVILECKGVPDLLKQNRGLLMTHRDHIVATKFKDPTFWAKPEDDELL